MTEFTDRYDSLYAHGYRSELAGYEIARFKALEQFLGKFVDASEVTRVLDYGSGNGLFVPLWKGAFPSAEIHACDISSVALEQLSHRYAEFRDRRYPVVDSRAAAPDGAFDLVVSVEVMEHVEDLSAYLQDIFRLLRPGGRFVWTTPCGNRLSIEHLFSLVSGQIKRTSEGYRRWAWEDPTHLRRLRSDEVALRLKECGFGAPIFRFRSHLFSFFVTNALPRLRLYRLKRLLEANAARLMCLDYDLFARFPNGASMIGVARKPV